MSLWSFLVLAAGTFGLLHFKAIPAMRDRIRVEQSPALLGKVGTLAVLQTMRTAAFLTLSAALGLLVLIGGAGLLGRALDADTLGALLSRMRSARGFLAGVRGPMYLVATLTLLGILAWISRNNARKRASTLLDAAYRERFDELVQRYRENALEPLPPTGEMKRLESEFEEVIAHAREAERELASVDPAGGAVQQLHTEVEQHLAALRARYVALDLGRRVDLKLDPDAILEPPPVTLREKLGVILRSRGIVGAVSGTGRALYYATLLLLVPALVGVESAAAAEALGKRVVSLEELRVTRSEEAARAQLEAAMAKLPPAAAASPVDGATLDRIARAFEDAAFASILEGRSTGPSLVSTLVRRQILSEAVRAPAAGAGEVRLATSADAPAPVDDAVRATLHEFERGWQHDRPLTGTGRRFRIEMEEWVRRSPALGERLARGVGESFLRPASADDVTRRLMKSMIGVVVEGQAPADPAVRALVSTLGESLAPEDLRRAYRVQSQLFLAELAQGSTLDQAVGFVLKNEVRYPHWTSAGVERLDGVMKEHMPRGVDLMEHFQPTLQHRSDPDVDLGRASAVTRDLAMDGAGAHRTADAVEEAAGALTSFEDLFPGQLGSDRTTTRGKLLAELQPDDSPRAGGFSREGGGPAGGLGGGSPGGPSRGAASKSVEPDLASAPVSPSSSQGRVADASGRARTARGAARARSFTRLRGFAKVGGVLIGREPAVDGALDFRDLSWRVDGERVTLTFVRGDGTRVTLPSYRADVVNGALLYAADGRPTTVTMVTASPLLELKVLLHPALLDTRLGCEAIDLDRLVDTYVGGAGPSGYDAREAASIQVHQIHELYRVAWAERVKELLGPLPNSVEPSREILEAAQEAHAITNSSEALAAASKVLASPNLLSRDASPVFDQLAFYDGTLSVVLKPCAGSGRSLDDFLDCVRTHARLLDEAGRQRALKPPPSYEIWSGVREHEFRLDPALAFARGSGARGGSPLRFILQVAFTSAPAFADEAAADSTPPWEFPALAAQVEADVRAGVRADVSHGYAGMVANLEAFTQLQRLFRAALMHRMGRDFPLERLVELGRATRPHVRAAWTPRWNPRPAKLEVTYATIFGQLADALEQPAGQESLDSWSPATRALVGSVRGPMERCARFYGEAEKRRLNPWRTDLTGAFAAECDFSGLRPSYERLLARSDLTPADRQVLRGVGQAFDLLRRVNRARELRRALGVEREEAAVRAGGSCRLE